MEQASRPPGYPLPATMIRDHTSSAVEYRASLLDDWDGDGRGIPQNPCQESPSRVGPEFGVQPFDMVVDGMRASALDLGNLADTHAGDQHIEHPLLADREPGILCLAVADRLAEAILGDPKHTPENEPKVVWGRLFPPSRGSTKGKGGHQFGGTVPEDQEQPRGWGG